MPRAKGWTRSSSKWSSTPGQIDTLHLAKLFPSTNSYGIPSLPPTDFIPDWLIQYGDKQQIERAKIIPDGAIHCFIDDKMLSSQNRVNCLETRTQKLRAISSQVSQEWLEGSETSIESRTENNIHTAHGTLLRSEDMVQSR